MSDLKVYIENLLQKCLDYTATQKSLEVELFALKSQDKYLNVFEGNQENSESSIGQNFVAKIYYNKKVATSCCSELSFSSAKKTIDRAIEISNFLEEDIFATLAPKDMMQFDSYDLQLYHPTSYTAADVLDFCFEVENNISANDHKTKLTNKSVYYSESLSCQGYANSHNVLQSVEKSMYNLSCSTVAHDKDNNLFKDYSFFCSRYPQDVFGAKNIAKIAAQRAYMQCGSIKPQTIVSPVIFSNRVSYSLINILTSAIKSSALYNSKSFLRDMLGKKIMPDFCSVYEKPYTNSGLNSSHYDSDGVKTQDKEIVKKGVLQTYLSDVYYGNKMGIKSTGNGGGVYNLSVEPNTDDLNSIIKNTTKGLVVESIMGHGININTGEYSQGARGYWVEGGEIKYPVHEITISGNLKDMLFNIEAIGADHNNSLSTKVGTILINNMTIAGT